MIGESSIGEWVYTLTKCELSCEPLKSMKVQIVAVFIVEHRINNEYRKILEEGDDWYMSITLELCLAEVFYVKHPP